MIRSKLTQARLDLAKPRQRSMLPRLSLARPNSAKLGMAKPGMARLGPGVHTMGEGRGRAYNPEPWIIYDHMVLHMIIYGPI